MTFQIRMAGTGKTFELVVRMCLICRRTQRVPAGALAGQDEHVSTRLSLHPPGADKQALSVGCNAWSCSLFLLRIFPQYRTAREAPHLERLQTVRRLLAWIV